MIGENAEHKREISYTEMFDRLSYMGNLFRLADSVTTTERPLLNTKPGLYFMERTGIRIQAFSDVPLSEHDSFVLAVGSPKTGFYQVPIIKLSEGVGKKGVDVLVSGTINDKGIPERFNKARKLSDMAYGLYTTGIDDARKTYAVALMPKTDLLGQDVIVAGRNIGQPQSIYHMIVNGFSLDRKIVGGRDSYGWPGAAGTATFIPVMFPNKDGIERFLRVGEILDQEQLSHAESQGVFPGLTFVAGTFSEERVLSFRGALLYSLTLQDLGATRSMKGAGRVGLEVGSESDVRYGRVKGDIESINGILALHFIGVEKDADTAQVKAAIEKLVR